MDFVAGAAVITAVVGVGVAVEKFAAERSAIRRVERLAAVLQSLPEESAPREVLAASLLHQVQQIDFRVRGPRSWWKIIFGWLLQTLGIVALVIAYLGAVAVLQPLLPKTDTSQGDDLLSQGLAIIAMALAAAAFWFPGRKLILGSKKAREKWFASTWPVATAPSNQPGRTKRKKRGSRND